MQLLYVLAVVAPAASPSLVVSPASLNLDGPGASYSLLVSLQSPDGRSVDRTRAAAYSCDSPIVRLDSPGVVHAVSDGTASVTVRVEGMSKTIPVRVTNSARPRNYHFVNDIEPLLIRYSCNSSGCHGKAEGQNGFELSVFGFDPAADHARLTLEGRGRRLLPSAPADSLLVRKMSGQLPHGGGARIRPGSPAYDTIVGWIAAGAPLGGPDAPTIVSLRVEPAERILAMRDTQQLRVLARTSLGQEIDVTATTRFQSNHDAFATVDSDGLITAGEVPGEAAIMASYSNVLTVCRVLVPRPGQPGPHAPVPENNDLDRLVHAKLRKLNVQPSGTCDDATFLRRAYLDILGTLPKADDARRFLADRRLDKRTRLVDDLLTRPEFADYWSLKWADLLRVDRAALGAKQARAYHQWIREQVARNTPLDAFARAVVTAEGPLDEVPAAAFFKAARKPGEMANSLAQVFLGVRIGCAECHHHPFDRWDQADYHGMTAYFSGLQLAGDTVSVRGPASARHPRTGETVAAHPLGGPRPAKAESGDHREALARWLTRADNPYFARNLANRVWAHFLGRGLVEPLDDVRDTNPPTNPELLDALAKHLVESRFDLRAMIRHITASRTYQRATTPNATNERDAANYSRGLLRRVPAEVLLDMVSQATGVPERFAGMPPGTRAVQLWDSKVPHYFLRAFGRPERTSACECERNPEPAVSQVLHLLNSAEMEGKLTHAGGRIARLVRRHGDDGSLVEEMYLTFFARFPEEMERKTALSFLVENRTRRREAAEDLAWGMLNALEFGFNH